MTTQLDLDFCSDYLKVDQALKRKAHLFSLRIGDGEAAAARASFMSMIHVDCLRFGSYEGFLLHYYYYEP